MPLAFGEAKGVLSPIQVLIMEQEGIREPRTGQADLTEHSEFIKVIGCP